MAQQHAPSNDNGTNANPSKASHGQRYATDAPCKPGPPLSITRHHQVVVINQNSSKDGNNIKGP